MTRPFRFITATSLFDGHDAAINVMRRILQASGAEVIHLAHNRPVHEVVEAALQEDVQAIAVSSYQGGHTEYFKYMIDMLHERNADHICVFGGGGGVIVPDEIDELHRYGVSKIFSPEDGQQSGLQGMIDEMLSRCRFNDDAGQVSADADLINRCISGDRMALAETITALENGFLDDRQRENLTTRPLERSVPVLGVTGTGGAGKSSLTDELIRRLRLDSGDTLSIAILAIDPSRRRTGGALLGDRIRMNSISAEHIYMRSIATRASQAEVPEYMEDIIAAVRLSGFDLIIVETPGIGQGDAGIVPMSDVSLYVMTPDFGAASQLEKIEMLDFADMIAINKFDRRGAEDARRDVAKQVMRNHEAFGSETDDMPVFGTIASRFNDDGVTALYQALLPLLGSKGLKAFERRLPEVSVRASTHRTAIVPPDRQRYLADIAASVRDYRQVALEQAGLARECQQLQASGRMLDESGKSSESLGQLADERVAKMDPRAKRLLDRWPEMQRRYSADQFSARQGGQSVSTALYKTSLSGSRIPRVALPKYTDHGDLLQWLLLENLPGYFPYTAGVFPFKREGEDPTRMFAGEGDAFRTNKRFRKLSAHSGAKRLSTAFDSVTLYGFDPDERPDIFGKIGNAGVSIATQDDMNTLFDGFDLCAPGMSVSMTINGPAPTILAMFFNTAIDQQLEKFEKEHGQKPTAAQQSEIRVETLRKVRGTVQADILKEDQGQNTCIFSTEFSLKVMGDIQQFFRDQQVQNFYSVSISGYHIAEAGANPLSQLAFTLANGFTYIEAYLARGMKIDEFAPNLSFFFSNGLDPEYAVLGRVARRIWATALRFRYGANAQSQRLKYHCQTSGRSLHAQEIDFNDIRTTLQALIAINDNCNSLHTNSYDEAITTPSESSVRRAIAIQMIINKEWGLSKNENQNQGSFIIAELTDLVEEAVLREFDKISDRGGVLGAMETGYQRGRIQDESLFYEKKKHDGSLPIIGVNTFLGSGEDQPKELELARSTPEEKASQLRRLREFKKRNSGESAKALQRLTQIVLDDANVFAELMSTVRYCSLGQITAAFFEVGGEYRRTM